SHTIRAGMPASVAWIEDLVANPSQIDEWLEQERAGIKETADPSQRTALERSIRRLERLRDRLPTLSIRYPDLTFDGTLVLHGTARVAELHVTANGHTLSDIYLHLPGDRLLFMGDLGFFASQPFMVFCDPGGWHRHLDHLARLDVDTYIPGHGPLGTRDDIALQRRYLDVVQDVVTSAVRERVPVDDVLAHTLPPPFDAWQADGLARWQANVRALYDRSQQS
ncbi:MAG TPA: MBL fold metallo-hydrolase, partial [Anaerolineae bacterium]|nr:MBL fold metallo-hydrolase [Anaerolineae bacterium]